MKECVEHFIEGRNAWKLGLIGFFTRIRGLITSGVIALLSMGLPWWWPKNGFPNTITLDLKMTFFLIILFISILTILGFIYLRDRSKRSLTIKSNLHNLTHYLRDHDSNLNGIISSKKIEVINHDYLCGFLEKTCNHIKNYLSNLFYDPTLEVAIRIAVESKQNEIEYRTLARSSGLNRSRQQTSEGVKLNEGIPRFFIDNNCQGVLRYNNINKAINLGLFKKTRNEELYPDEIVSFLVTPINAWDGNVNNMIGLLYVTSRNSNSFKITHTDSVKFVTDLIAPFITITNNLLKKILKSN